MAMRNEILIFLKEKSEKLDLSSALIIRVERSREREGERERDKRGERARRGEGERERERVKLLQALHFTMSHCEADERWQLIT